MGVYLWREGNTVGVGYFDKKKKIRGAIRRRLDWNWYQKSDGSTAGGYQFREMARWVCCCFAEDFARCDGRGGLCPSTRKLFEEKLDQNLKFCVALEGVVCFLRLLYIFYGLRGTFCRKYSLESLGDSDNFSPRGASPRKIRECLIITEYPSEKNH